MAELKEMGDNFLRMQLVGVLFDCLLCIEPQMLIYPRVVREASLDGDSFHIEPDYTKYYRFSRRPKILMPVEADESPRP